MKQKNYALPLALIFSLFFLWAISSNLLPTMIRQLMKTCELNTFEASFTETAYWLAYFIFPIPIAMFMKRYSYKAGIIGEDVLDDYTKNTCPGCGSCSGMYTANSMNCLCEAIGMALPGNGTIPAVYAART